MVKVNHLQPIFVQRNIEKTGNDTIIYTSDELSQCLAGKTNINGVIEDFQKSPSTGDCYFLTQLKNLSRKSWGAKAIKEAIKPDGMGGAYVTFKGALEPLTFKKKSMTFHVSAEEILSVRENQNTEIDTSKYHLETEEDLNQYLAENAELHRFSTGDDDVLLMELAYDKYMRQHGFDMANGGVSRPLKGNMIWASDNYDVVNLIMGSENEHSVRIFGTNNTKEIDKMLGNIKDKMDDYVLYISFKDDNPFGVLSSHAYEIIDISEDRKGNPMIILTEPYDSAKPITMNYYDVITAARSFFAWENPQCTQSLLSSYENTEIEETSEKDIKEMDSLQNIYYKKHEECVKEEECQKQETENQKSKVIEETYRMFETILEIKNREERLTKLTEFFEKTDKTALNLMIGHHSSGNACYIDIMKKISDTESGIFRRKSRKKLMLPYINYIAEQAKTAGVDEETINDFKAACNKELSRWLIYRKKNVVHAFDTIMNAIVDKDNTFFD